MLPPFSNILAKLPTRNPHTNTRQLYLALYLQLIPLPNLISEQIIPVVCHIPYITNDSWLIAVATLLGPSFLRRVPTIQAWLGGFHIQRCTEGTCRADVAD